MSRILKSSKNKKDSGTLHEHLCVHLGYCLAEFLEWKMFQTKIVEKMKTRVSCSVSFHENRVFYDTMWKIIVEQSRPHMPIKYGVCALRAG